MINEHAISYKEKLTIEDLEYLVLKSNRIGKSGRDIIRVYHQSDREGTHVYFEATSLEKRCE